MTEGHVLSLLRFYLACVEAEDRQSLTKKLSALHHSLVSPWDEDEPLFHPEETEVLFDVSLKSDEKVLLGGTALVGGPDRFFYGYPIFLDEEGFLSPLFVAEVEVEHYRDRWFAARPVSPEEIRLNQHVFRRQHAPLEELRAIQEELEGPYGSFSDRLRASFEALGLPCPEFDPDRLEPYPKADSPRGRWVNRPILFKSERSTYTYHLRRELEALTKFPRLSHTLATTAAGVVAGMEPPISRRATEPSVAPIPLLHALPLNPGQEDAARAALQAPLTVVTGPPGTGKSQVVVDILATCAHGGRPVLFASKNGKAVDVVRERLRKILGEDRDWTLRLGSRQAMEAARQEMDARLGSLTSHVAPRAPSTRSLHEVDVEIAAVRRQIVRLEHAQAAYAQAERDRQIAEDVADQPWVESWATGDASPELPSVERLTATAEALAGRCPASAWLRLWRTFAPVALHRKLRAKLAALTASLPDPIRSDLDSIADRPDADPFVPVADACVRLARLARWRAAVEITSRALAAVEAEETADVLSRRQGELQRRRGKLARAQLRASWTARLVPRADVVRHVFNLYFGLSSRLRQSRGRAFFEVLDEFKRVVHTVADALPVWIVTNLSVRNALPLEPGLFDLVIIDEASQCDIPSALPLLFRARRALIIGDPRQLRHISTLPQPVEEELARLHGVADLLATWSYNQRSLYELAEAATIERGDRPVLLAEHYRSHPEIIEFSNQKFYHGQLILRTPLRRLRKRLGTEPAGLFWHDVHGTVKRSSRSAVNEDEVRAVLRLLDHWMRTGFLLRDKVSFGVVTPFRLQMETLAEAIRASLWWELVEGRLSVGTAHRFQGDERDVMIFSPVVAEGMLPRLVRWVADTDQLLNVAITRARAALHVVGDLRACVAAGGFLGDFAVAARDSSDARDPMLLFESPAETRMAELLGEVGLWFAPQHTIDRYRLDFLVVTPFGNRYDLEVDGRGHRTDEAIRRDEARDAALTAKGLRVLRVDARHIFEREGQVRTVLQRLV
jgi:very-short-patch-repair endonuclease